MLTGIVTHFSSPRAACKQCSAGLGVLILLIGGLAGLNPTKMLWAAGPLLLLGLTEAGYAAHVGPWAQLLPSGPEHGILYVGGYVMCQELTPTTP